MNKQIEGTLNGLKLIVKKDFYIGLWNIRYEDGMQYAGPYKTKKEAVEKLKEICEPS